MGDSRKIQFHDQYHTRLRKQVRESRSRNGWRTKSRNGNAVRGKNGKSIRFQVLQEGTEIENCNSVSQTMSHAPKSVLIQTIPARNVELKLENAWLSELNPSHLDLYPDRVAYYIDQIKNGRTIDPPLVHRLPNGKVEILDGMHRIEAYKRLGYKQIPVVENSIWGTLTSLKSGSTGDDPPAPRSPKEEHLAYKLGRAIGTVGAGGKYVLNYVNRNQGKTATTPPSATNDDVELNKLIEKSEHPKSEVRQPALNEIRKKYPDFYPAMNWFVSKSFYGDKFVLAEAPPVRGMKGIVGGTPYGDKIPEVPHEFHKSGWAGGSDAN
jgi:ParB-like nuclease domain